MTTTVNPAQGMSLQQLAAHASQLYNQQYNQQYNQYHNQLAGGVHYGQLAQQIQQQSLPLHQWVFDGRPCTTVEFAERCYGDTAERDVFLLKYTKIGELE